MWIFNLRGDMNGDGTVNDDDRDALSGVLGVRSSEPSFMRWYDSNGDGIIDEADLAAVGYFWGSSM